MSFGPWKLPIVGHLPLLGFFPHETFLKWKTYYGPILSIQFGSFPAVVISDGDLIKAAFGLPSLSGRPKIKYLEKIDVALGGGFGGSDGPAAREIRFFTQQKLKCLGYGSRSMETGILEQIPSLLEIFQRHLTRPLPIQHQFHTIMLKYLWSLVNGYTTGVEDPEFQEFGENVAELSTLPPVVAVTVFLPKLADWFPALTGYTRSTKLKKNLDFISLHIQQHEETRIPGLPRDLIDWFLDKKELEPEVYSTKSILITLWELLLAGVDTSAASIEWIIYYLVKYPEIQAKLSEDIQSIIGNERTPSLSDRPRLPYFEAMLQETMRKATILPLSVLHSAMEDTKFKGFLI